MQYLLKGAERHLHSPIDNVRILGMVVSEYLLNYLHDANIKQLKFEVDKLYIFIILINF